jgi:radical SAM superfamily enzyme YgiQ (UPF0313 family)
MPKRVLLVSANRCTAPDPVFPLGLAHLSAALREAGHECRCCDLLAESSVFEDLLSEYRPDLVGISLRNIDDVLIRKRETYFNVLEPLCRAARDLAGAPVVIGGSGFSIFPRELLELSGADYGVCGAGEAPLLALLEALDTGCPAGNGDEPSPPLTEVPGLVYRKNGEMLLSPAGPERPVPRLMDADRPSGIVSYYLQNGGMLNVQTQRGCAFHCCYCTYPIIEGRAHRRNPPETVAEEFAQLQRLGAKYAFIVDSVFNSSQRHVTEICEALLHRNVKLGWGCFLRPQGLTPDLMKLMARAGLQHIEFGSDSFSDDVLSSYQKGFTFDEIFRSSELARQEKVDYCHFLIAGGPGETPATLREGFERSQKLSGAVMMAVVGMRIYPGTQLCQRAMTEGLVSPGTNLLNPTYYLSPELTADEVFAQLQEFARVSPNWIVGDPTPAYAKLVDRLRRRGVAGPLWSYLSMIQRLWPDGKAPQVTVPNGDEPSPPL